MELYPFQRRAVRVITKIWKTYSGAVLRGDEGIGKTIITAAVCGTEPTLIVAPARTIKGLRDKLDQYMENGLETNINIVSYHKFADVLALPASELNKYSRIVFDECHNLRNYKAGWTTRLCKLRHIAVDRKLLFLSATPMIKSPLDYIYVLRKTGVFDHMRMIDIKYKYFNAQQSRYGDFLEMGKFRHEEDFQAHIDQVSYDIKQEDADSQMPIPNFHAVTINETYDKPKDITEETAKRLAAGKAKIPQAVNYIQKDIERRKIGISLTLCHFHEVANELADKLGFRVALTSKDVKKEFEYMAKHGGHLVTTLGLTDSNLDLNECDTIYMVESTYSAMQDRQSIRRCIRIGKRTVVQVFYFMFKDELPLLKSMSRLYLGGDLKPTNSKMGPSSLKRLEMCPGSYWIESTGDNKYEASSYFGTLAHSALERCLKNPDIPISEAYSKELQFAIEYCRERLKYDHGIEEKVHYKEIHPDMYGTCDFWTLNNGHLTVYDYKNGVAKIKAKDNLQLLAYAAMIQHTHNIPVKKCTVAIIQGGKVDYWDIKDYNLDKTVKRIKGIVDAVMAAKEDPLKYINQGKCDFFCPATKYHIMQREQQQLADQEEDSMAKKTQFTVEGHCIYYQETGDRVRYGISSETIPEQALGDEFADDIKLIAKEMPFNKDYKNYSFFGSTKKAFLPKEQAGVNPKGKKVTVKFNVTIAKATDKYPAKAFINIKSIEPKETPKESAENSDLLSGWGAGA